MPARRRYRSRKRTTRRKKKTYQQQNGITPYIQKATSVANAAYSAYALATMMKGIINSEKKCHDLDISNTIADSGRFEYLSGIATGDDFSDREGRSIRAKSLQVRLRFNMAAAATDTQIRMIIFIDKSNVQANPSSTDLLKTNTIYSLRSPEPDMQKRFIILLDKVFILTDNLKQELVFNFYKKLDMVITYEGTTGGVGDAAQNAVFAYFVSSEDTNLPTMLGTSRIRYYDN